MAKKYISELHGNVNKKTRKWRYFITWKEKFRKRTEQDWSKISSKEVGNE